MSFVFYWKRLKGEGAVVVEVVKEWTMDRNYHYSVWVDGVKFDEFTSRGTWLTWAEMQDVAAGYEEGLDGYRRAM